MTDPREKAGRIAQALAKIDALAAPCFLCGNRCGVDRLGGESGLCRTTESDVEHLTVSSATLHFGEEPMLVGNGGSGTVFFTHCNLRCVFCQNYQISQLGLGDQIHFPALSRHFLDLQEQGAENINLVTPTHYLPAVLRGLQRAYETGLRLPLVHNTNGFETVEVVQLLDGIVDVYLPDCKYMDAKVARQYSSVPTYPETAKAAIAEMYRQVGPVQTDDRGVAQQGLIIRHLVLPHDLSGSYDFLLWLKDQGMLDVTLSIMSQYSPQHRAREYEMLRESLSPTDYAHVVDYAVELGFEHLLVQETQSQETYLPDFRNDRPFDGE